MNYQVWVKEEYGDLWKKVDCGDLPAVERELEKSVRAGLEPLVTVEVPYRINIKISDVGNDQLSASEKYKRGITRVKKEVGIEVKKSKAKPDKGAGGEGDRQVRRGDEAAPEGLDQGSGDSGAGPGAGNK